MNEDIEAIIEASRHFKFHEPTGTTSFNRLSSLPESKKHLKLAIKERLRLLAAAYVSLATFIDDDLVDFLESDDANLDKGKLKKIYTNVIESMEQLENDIRTFNPLEP